MNNIYARKNIIKYIAQVIERACHENIQILFFIRIYVL